MVALLLQGFYGMLDGSDPLSKEDLNSHTWIIVSAMGGVIAVLGGVIAKLYKDLQECQKERKKFIEEQLSLLRTLRNEFDK